MKYDNSDAKKINVALTGQGIENYLYEFKRENDFAQRQAQSYYINYFQSIIESITVPVFSQTIKRETNNTFYNEFIKNVDKRGTSLNEFMYNTTKNYKAQDAGFIIMNNYKEFAQTVNDQLENRQFPWIEYKDISDLIEYELDEDYRLTYIKFYNGKDQSGKQLTISYTNDLIIEEEVALFGPTKLGKTYPNPFGFIPIITLDPDIIGEYNKKDLADTTIAIYNQLSESRDLERTQAFCLLEIPNDQPQDGDVELGPDNIIWVPTNSSRGSTYISPDSAVLKTLKEAALTTNELLQVQANQIGATVTNSSAGQSGEALSYEWQGKTYVLKATGVWCETIEMKIFNMFMKITNQTGTYEVVYPKEFRPSVVDVNNKIAMVSSAQTLGIEFSTEETAALKQLIISAL